MHHTRIERMIFAPFGHGHAGESRRSTSARRTRAGRTALRRHTPPWTRLPASSARPWGMMDPPPQAHSLVSEFHEHAPERLPHPAVSRRCVHGLAWMRGRGTKGPGEGDDGLGRGHTDKLHSAAKAAPRRASGRPRADRDGDRREWRRRARGRELIRRCRLRCHSRSGTYINRSPATRVNPPPRLSRRRRHHHDTQRTRVAFSPRIFENLRESSRIFERRVLARMRAINESCTLVRTVAASPALDRVVDTV